MENHVIKEVNSPISYPLGTLRHKILYIYKIYILFIFLYIVYIYTKAIILDKDKRLVYTVLSRVVCVYSNCHSENK